MSKEEALGILEEVEENYTAIHNTKHKKEMRRQMQNGERPAECEYCWKMEDMKTDETVGFISFYIDHFENFI